MIILSIHALKRCFVVFFRVPTYSQLASSTSNSDILSFQKIQALGKKGDVFIGTMQEGGIEAYRNKNDKEKLIIMPHYRSMSSRC